MLIYGLLPLSNMRLLRMKIMKNEEYENLQVVHMFSLKEYNFLIKTFSFPKIFLQDEHEK